VVLDDRVEEHGEESAVDDPGRTLVDDGEADRARRAIAVHTDLVCREAGIEGANVARMVDVDATVLWGLRTDARRRVGGGELPELGLGAAQRGGEPLQGGVRGLEREHETGDRSQLRCDGE
jgi:hypothetical protein